LRVSENKVLGRIIGPEKVEVTGRWEKRYKGFIICTLHQILLRWSNKGG